MNYDFSETVRNMFNFSGGRTVCSRYRNDLTIPMINKALILNITDETFFLPLMFINKLNNILMHRGMKKGFLTLIYPLFYGKEETKSTAAAIIKQMLRGTTTTELTRVTAKSGEVYYGGRGIILDGNLNPLLLAGYKTSIEDAKFHCKEAIVYIDPICFGNSDKVCKAIVKDVIPCLVEGVNKPMGVPHYMTPFILTEEAHRNTIRVIVEDLIPKFITPTKPKNSYLSENINNFLYESL